MAVLLTDYDKATANTLLEMFDEARIYNVNTMKEAASLLANRMDNQPKPRVINIGLSNTDITPQKRSISEYGDIINKEDK